MSQQQNFINQCKQKATGANFANDLAELIGVNVDAAYRRIRGATALTYDEIERMCIHYNISFDSVINYQGSLVPFQFNAMFQENFSIEVYLQNIANQIKDLATTDDSKFVITAMDLPYFRQFGYKGLSRFKLFFWQRSVLNLETFKRKQFKITDDENNYDLLTKSIYEDYHRVDSTEIWTPETIDSSIMQIKYYLESGLFSTNDIVYQLCDELEDLLLTAESQAEFGRKSFQNENGIFSANFAMYQSDIYLSNNSIQAYKEDRIYTYVSFNSFNSLMSFSPAFANDCHEWIEQIRTKSILLSEVSEKLRFQYFMGLRKKINVLRKMVPELV
jgi:hypothetical protein